MREVSGVLVVCAIAVGACGDPAASPPLDDGGRREASATDSSTPAEIDGGLASSDSPAGAESSEVADAAKDVTAAPRLGAPIVAASGAWTWVDFPDALCDDGSPTGIAVYPSATSDKVLVFFNGGGACWSYETCAVLNTSTHGPFGATQFASISVPAGSIFDHAAAANPFKDYSDVFVPYCTGDLHAGNAVTMYAGDGGSVTVHHVGHANVLAYLARLGATFPKPGQIAVTGSSAGGGGALFNYDSLRAYWPAAPTVLVDDSLPLLEGDAIPAATRAAWYAGWSLGTLVDPICGAGCRTDLSLFMGAIATRYPSDRMALLSSQQDATISAYFQLSASSFQASLDALATDVLDPLGHFEHFYVTGNSHTMLGAPASFTAASTPLWTWLTQQVAGNPSWASSGP